MCFSAGASFTASALLTILGTGTLRKVHKSSQMVFAGIPMFFAFQQFTEGIVWLVIGHTEYAVLKTVSSYTFLIMALVIWPIMIPLSVLLMEENISRKRILFALLAVGAAIGSCYAYRLVFYDIDAKISGGHIVYFRTQRGFLELIRLLAYMVATITPFFISTIKRTYILGIMMLLSFIVSAIFYTQYLASVWCYFAAIMSFMILYITTDAYKKFHFERIGKMGEILQKHVRNAIDL